MGQFILIVLFIIALLTGFYAYFCPVHQLNNPIKFISDQSGYSSMEEQNTKKIQQVNIITSQGLAQVHHQMADIAKIQKNSSAFDVQSRKDQELQRLNQQQDHDQTEQVLDLQQQERIYRQHIQDQMQHLKDQQNR